MSSECNGYSVSNTIIPGLKIQYTASAVGTPGTKSITGYTYSLESFFELDLGKTATRAGITFSELADTAFQNLIRIQSIVIPDTVVIIGTNCFEGCGLVTATLPSNITTIREKTFFNCVNLESITIPATVIVIETESFAGCISLVDFLFFGRQSDITVGLNPFSTGTISLAYGSLANGWIPDTYWNSLRVMGALPPTLCLTEGTRVLTPSGYRPVEQLEKFGYITTADGRNVMIKHVHHSQHYNVGEQEAPFHVPAHAIAENVPSHDVKLSPDHLVHIGDDLWLTPRGMAKRSDNVVQYDIGKHIHYYAIMTPNYFQDNLVIEDGVVVEAYGARDIVYDEEKKAYRRKAKSDL